MSIRLTAPSKTFLIGEYVALKGGPALILSTNPRFELIATKQVHKGLDHQNIHPESPAGKLIREHSEFFRNYHLQFIDPYRELGGFGASSAQFILLYALKHYVQGIKIDDFKLLKEYKHLAWRGKGMAPSGADILTQLHGGLCFFHLLEKQIQAFDWPFEDLGYCLIHTENKLETHQYLEELKEIDVLDLEAIVFHALASLKQANSQDFIEAINQYAQRLEQQGLVIKHTKEKLRFLSHCPHIVAAKGCGALGADIVLTLFYRQKQSQVIEWLKKNQFHLIIYGHQLATGLHVI